jgi:hypothetical protein
MTTTPRPITRDSDTLADRSPIGTRYSDGHTTYTLIGYSIDPYTPKAAYPVFVDDYDLANPNTDLLSELTDGKLNLLPLWDVVTDGETLEVAPADPETAGKARAAAVKQYQARPYRDTGELARVMAFDDLTTDEEIAAFIDFAKAELELRKAQWALEKASRARSERIARIADIKGSQRTAAQTLGLNQSTVSRALRERPELP